MRASRRRLAAVAMAVALVAAVGNPAYAAQKPSPQRLWDAYPLKPGDARSEPPDPAPTPTAAPTRAASSPASGTVRARDGKLEIATVIVAAAIAFGVGLGTMTLLRSRTTSRRPAVAPAVSVPPPAACAFLRAPATEATRPRPPPATTVAPPPPKREPAPAAPAAPAEAQDAGVGRGERFARRQPWPKDAAQLWTCEIEWKAGYRKSAFRAMARAPRVGKRSAIGEAPALSWMFMADPEPPTPELAKRVGALMEALVSAGWEHIGRGDQWFSQRFIWRQDVEPRPVVPLTERAERV